MVEIKDKNGKTIQRSKNLRGIIKRGGKVGVRLALANMEPDSDGDLMPYLTVWFIDGTWVKVQFGDRRVLVEWVKNRRCFNGVRDTTDKRLY